VFQRLSLTTHLSVASCIGLSIAIGCIAKIYVNQRGEYSDHAIVNPTHAVSSNTAVLKYWNNTLSAGFNTGLLTNNVIQFVAPTWQQQFPVNSPSARYAQSMAFDVAHGELVLFGGVGGGVAASIVYLTKEIVD